MSNTLSDIIKRRIQLRDFVEREQAAFDARLKPYFDAATALENAALEKLNLEGEDSVKTEFGTVYKTRLLTTKVVDRDAFMGFVVENEAYNFLTSAVSKEAVKEYMEAHQSAPPGVDTSTIVKVNFRRA